MAAAVQMTGTLDSNLASAENHNKCDECGLHFDGQNVLQAHKSFVHKVNADLETNVEENSLQDKPDCNQQMINVNQPQEEPTAIKLPMQNPMLPDEAENSHFADILRAST